MTRQDLKLSSSVFAHRPSRAPLIPLHRRTVISLILVAAADQPADSNLRLFKRPHRQLGEVAFGEPPDVAADGIRARVPPRQGAIEV